MKLVRFRIDDRSRLGIVLGDRVQSVVLESDHRGLVPDVVDAVNGRWTEEGPSYGWNEIEVQTPVADPAKIIGVGLNYRDHVLEGGYDIPEEPMIWAKATSAAHPPNAPVVYPVESEQLDYEGEMAVVIGRKGRRISADDAIDHIAGFTCFNDVSARDIQYAVSQIFRGKGFDTFAPMGPSLATPDSFDHDSASITTRVNGEVRQDSSTAEMLFKATDLVEYISAGMTLYPGDVIATGTPPGVGVHREPPKLLNPGDRVSIEIEGIGTLENPIVSKADSTQ